MILKRFYNNSLAHASYLVGCPESGEAIVVDPNRDAKQYIAAASEERLNITAVTETHIHADYLSGVRELALMTGAKVYLSAEGGADWKYAFAEQDGVQLLKGDDSFKVGTVRFDVVATPGHTPEHISFVITDESTSPVPLGVFTGDFIFVGDVGRPDLLERAAKIEGTMEAGARTLYKSITAFKSAYPDFLLLWPAHGAGSACGKNLGGVPVSSLGYEKAANWALQDPSEEKFVQEILSGQPDPPKYFAKMKELNKTGPAILGPSMKTRPIAAEQLRSIMGRDAVLLDLRAAAEYVQNSWPDALHIPSGKGLLTWAGWLVPYETPIYLLVGSQDEADSAASDLRLIGLDDVRGWFDMSARRDSGAEAAPVAEIGSAQIAGEDAFILDVRTNREYENGHIPGATNIPLGHLFEGLASVPKDKRIAVHCQGGLRSPIAVSVLRRAGFADVVNVPGGFSEYESHGLPVEAAGRTS
ncbi:MAG: rhodanese-like domain-containing protein [Fimbriimonadales bacterium]